MKFKVGDKVRVIDISVAGLQIGTKAKVIEVVDNDGVYLDKNNTNGLPSYYSSNKIELIKSKKQRIRALEEKVAKQGEEIAELKLIVGQIRQPSTEVQEALDKADWERGELEGVIEFEGAQYRKVDRLARDGDVIVLSEYQARLTTDVTAGKPYKVHTYNHSKDIWFQADEGAIYVFYRDGYARTHKTVDVYEPIPQDVQRRTVECEALLPFDDVDEPYEPTPNELRAEIIEKAKAFVEEWKTNMTGVAKDGPFKGQCHTFESIYEVKLNTFSKAACNVEFIVNEEKRNVVALLRGVDTNKVYARGIAKCMPDDVFNEHIGKAIALGRALNLDVSEFENCVQPDEKVIGMKTLFRHQGEQEYIVELLGGKEICDYSKGTAAYDSYVARHSKITDDTNAIYEVK